MSCKGLLHVDGITDIISYYTHDIEFNTHFVKLNSNQTGQQLGNSHIHAVHILHAVFTYSL